MKLHSNCNRIPCRGDIVFFPYKDDDGKIKFHSSHGISTSSTEIRDDDDHSKVIVDIIEDRGIVIFNDHTTAELESIRHINGDFRCSQPPDADEAEDERTSKIYATKHNTDSCLRFEDILQDHLWLSCFGNQDLKRNFVSVTCVDPTHSHHIECTFRIKNAFTSLSPIIAFFRDLLRLPDSQSPRIVGTPEGDLKLTFVCIPGRV